MLSAGLVGCMAASALMMGAGATGIPQTTADVSIGNAAVDAQAASGFDKYFWVPLGTQPYDFETTSTQKYFRLWIRNQSDGEIYGTITYADGSTQEFTVRANKDYETPITEAPVGSHSVSLRGESGFPMKGYLSLHIDSVSHFRLPIDSNIGEYSAE